jgi:pantoate--beta-alanine ligase
MRTVRTGEELAGLRQEAARRRGRVAFVPTMGALHPGHLSLLEIARRQVGGNGVVVASIFVNPTQFAPHEDFDAYPRPVERDLELLAGAGCDAVFLPEHETIYPAGFGSWIYPAGAARGLEGDQRPQFFRGVATVVARLFALVRPDLAVFGEKDAQQLAVVRQLVRDLGLPIEIVGGPIVREADGLAMSSRNVFLSPEERSRAKHLHAALQQAVRLFAAGERRSAVLRECVTGELESTPGITVQYVQIVDPESFQPVPRVESEAIVALAARLGSTRLIDNVRLGVRAGGES